MTAGASRCVPKLSVVIPAFNEAARIDTTMAAVTAYLDAGAEGLGGLPELAQLLTGRGGRGLGEEGEDGEEEGHVDREVGGVGDAADPELGADLLHQGLGRGPGASAPTVFEGLSLLRVADNQAEEVEPLWESGGDAEEELGATAGAHYSEAIGSHGEV